MSWEQGDYDLLRDICQELKEINQKLDKLDGVEKGLDDLWNLINNK